MHALVAGFDQWVVQRPDNGVVQQLLQALEFALAHIGQSVAFNGSDQRQMAAFDLGKLGVLGRFGIDRNRRPLDDAAELIGRARQLQPRLDELNARARMNGQHALGFQDFQRIPQRRHRNIE